MKAGWKTRMDERRYFEDKLELRRWKIAQKAMAEAMAQAIVHEAAVRAEMHEPWINLTNPGQTRHQWEQEQRAKGVPASQIRTGSVRKDP